MNELQYASSLDDATLGRIRDEAEAHRSSFIDPVIFRKAQQVLPRVNAEWLTRVAGHPVGSWTRLGNAEMTVAVRAAEIDAAYLAWLATAEVREAHEVQRAAESARQARDEESRREWAALQARLPVMTAVWHNWTARHLEGYEQGADHIVVLELLVAGRLRREPHQSLCWTPSRARQLRYVEQNPGDEHRMPDCKACLRTACSITSHPA